MSAESLPRSAWVFAWLCLADQLLRLATRGLSQSNPLWVVLSVVLTAVVVRWFSSGVLRARTGRLVVVWILLGAGLLLGVVGTLSDLDLSGVLLLALSVGQVVTLAVFCSTPYFQAQRAAPGAARADLGVILAIAVVVGVLGGLTAPDDGNDAPIQLRVGL